MRVTPPADPAESAVWWLRTGLGDLEAAQTLLDTDSLPARCAAQFAHQAAERALKAAIAASGEHPPRTHDLVYLGMRCDVDVQRALARIDVVLLSAVLARSRYTEADDPPISRQQAAQWLTDAHEIMTIVGRHAGVDVDSLPAA